MAQTSPPAQLFKHPAPNIPNANGPPNVTQFTPRKEFIRDQRVISSFALLTLSGANLVRLYSFPGPVISALRRLFDQHDLIVSVREHSHKHFFEFALDGRPWARRKSVESEKLIVSILCTVFQCGYSFLSSIDYGREPDDRVAIAFSKPVALSTPSAPSTAAIGSLASSSTVVLPQPTRTPFAISFVSPSVLRVVDPPLASTPAIIQAVRGSWPLGVVSEKKLGDATYQFKLKGYKFFQEDNFAADSLHQILTLLSTLDTNAFTLLTSLNLTNRSRKQDLWIFTGPAEGSHSGESAQSSPAGSSMTLKAENSPNAAQTSNEKLTSVASTSRLSTMPAISSPLNPAVAKAMGNTLRKVSPKVNIPLAFMDDVDSAANSPVDNKQHPFSSSMGSVDMTGIGSGRGKGGERLSRSPDVFYMTAGVPAIPNEYVHGHRDELNPWNAPGYTLPSSQTAPVLPYPAFLQEPNAPHSPPPQEAVPALSHSGDTSTDNPPGADPPTTPPSEPTDSTSLPYLTPQVQSPAPTLASRQDYFGDNGSSPDRSQDSVRRNKDGSPRGAADTPRTPTPPLLPSVVFRDSALSITTGRTSYEIPIQWAGRDPEPGRTTLGWIKEEDEGSKRRATPELKERPREQSRPRLERSNGPMLPGAWAPKDERRSHDVVISTLPPTIREQPSQEHDERGHFTSRGMSQPAKTEAMTREASRSPESVTSAGRSGVTTTTSRRRSPTRRDTDGWVLVNIERADRKDKTSSTGRQTQSVSPARRAKSPTLGPPTQRPTPHKRSSSDSHVHSPQRQAQGTPVSSMSAAAKTIVIIDAVGAKEKEQKSSSSGFKKMFSKSRDKASKE